MKIFECGDYKNWVRYKIDENKGTRGYQANLARAAGCSRSFLSQVLSGDVDFTRDHIAGMAHFWSMNDAEFEYLLVLVDLSRSKSDSLRNFLNKKRDKIQQRQRDLSKRVKSGQSSPLEVQTTYYSSWYWAAIHILLCVPAFRSPQAIAKKLSLTVSEVTQTLERLKEMGLVKFENGKWEPVKKDINLGSSSIMSKINHINWRQKAISELQKPSHSASDVHYSSVFAMSLADATRLQEMLHELVVKQRQLVAPSAEEELFCFNCDFFTV